MARPVVADLMRAPDPLKPAERKAARAASAQKNAPVSDELAAAVAAATAGMPGTTSAPFITLMQKEGVAREMRRSARLRFAKIGLAAVASLIVLHLAVTRVFYRAPTAEALQAHGLSLASTVVPYYSSLLQPLQLDGAVVALNEAVDSRRLRYAVEVTLRLREPLYAPAFTNGTVVYRQLQESLQSARAQELKFKLFEGKTAPEVPDLPLLIQRSHPAGDAMVVRVPFEARRFGWVWRLGPPLLANHSVNRRLEGDALLRFTGSPYLIFENAGTLADIRARSRLARSYIIEVSKEVQKRSNVEAVSAFPAEPASAAQTGGAFGFPGDASLPAAATQAAVDPNAPAAEFDPNAPAIVVPGLGPNTPAAFDPHAPAVVAPLPPASPADGLTITVPGLVEVQRPNAPSGPSSAPSRTAPPAKR